MRGRAEADTAARPDAPAQGGLFIVLLLTTVTFCAIYGPQPILPTFRAEFGLSQATASLMITSVLVPLGIAPLFYGFLLEVAPIKRVLVLAVSLLAVSELCMAVSGSFAVILGVRFAQGLLIPAALTALMTYVAVTRRGPALQRAFAAYISATIFGGFAGRLSTGFFSTMFGWRSSFLFLFAAFVVCLAVLIRLKPAPRADHEHLRPADAWDMLRRPGFLRVYLLVGCAFFVYAALPNFLPFRLREISGGISELRIGLTYSGYLLGLAMSLYSPRLVARLGGENRALITGFVGYLAGALIFLIPGQWLIFTDMFLFCASMGVIQAVSPGYINRRAKDRKGVANGLYICFYYSSGSLGTFLPGLVYTSFGWSAFIACLCAVICLGLALAMGLAREERLSRTVEPAG